MLIRDSESASHTCLGFFRYSAGYGQLLVEHMWVPSSGGGWSYWMIANYHLKWKKGVAAQYHPIGSSSRVVSQVPAIVITQSSCYSCGETLFSPHTNIQGIVLCSFLHDIRVGNAAEVAYGVPQAEQNVKPLKKYAVLCHQAKAKT